MTESQLVTQILEWLALKRILAWRTNNIPVIGRTFRGRKGVSDISGVLPSGVALFIEAKLPGEKLTAEQERFIADVNKAGGLAFVAYDLKDVIRELGA